MSSARGRPAAESGQAHEETGGYQQTGAYSQSAGYSPSGAYSEERGYAPETREGRYVGQRRAGGAASLVGTILAGALMIISGATAFLAGLAMVIRGGFFVYHAGYAYHFTTKGWGFIELVIGGLIFFAGVCVILGMTWARVLGVVLATLGAISSFLIIPFYPLWSIVLIAVYLFIIWALVHRGRDVV
jgi:hypothetical protein